MLNGVNSLIMMKTDVLDSLREIRVCMNYKSGNQMHGGFPFDLAAENVEPEYETLAGWNSPVTDKTSFSELPAELKEYIGHIEKSVELPVDIVSVGPDRTQTIRRDPL